METIYEDVDGEIPNQDEFRYEEIERMKCDVEKEIRKRKILGRNYKKASNTLDGLETTFFVLGITFASVGVGGVITAAISLPLAVLSGALGLTGKLILPKLRRKVKKHERIVENNQIKLARINNLISKSIVNGEISASEFSLIISEFLEKSEQTSVSS